MKKTLGSFKEQQSETLLILEKLQTFLQQGESLGVEIDSKIKNKLESVIQSVSDEKLKVALIGGFSDGKTAIAAAWLENLDKSTMKISHQESSNEVKVYDVDSNFTLIDTPGLFGFKEQFNTETHSIEKYKDITKKYVSEAHLVLYVMDPVNPIKNSHKEDLIWLFRTLNLLPRTVFVLSRFDEVADVEDELEYKDSLAIKRENVMGRLKELINVSENEANEQSIIAVAANPFDKGTDHWLSHLEEFKTLSHIAALQEATAEKIKANGGSVAIAEETKKSIILDVLTKQLPIAVAHDEKIGQEVARLESVNDRLKKQLASTGNQISNVRISLREFVLDYFTDLILQAKGLSIDTFTDFFEREIGTEGVVLSTRLQNEFERQLGAVNLEVGKMKVGFESEINHFNTAVKVLGKQGLDYVLKSNLINNTTVLAARDGIVTVGKTVGKDLGKLLKFKPWGAVKFAKGVNGVLVFVGVALEAWDTYKQAEREDIFHNSIKEMVDNFNEQREELLDLINGDQFIEQFFVEYLELKSSMEDVEQNLVKRRVQRQKFYEWREAVESINAEFTVLKG
jgi:GTP-binding protein EngB required for normal cell division